MLSSQWTCRMLKGTTNQKHRIKIKEKEEEKEKNHANNGYDAKRIHVKRFNVF